MMRFCPIHEYDWPRCKPECDFRKEELRLVIQALRRYWFDWRRERLERVG